MKRIVKYLIPCLVACFMVFGLVQTASFTFAEDDIVEGSSSEPSTYDLQNPEVSSYAISGGNEVAVGSTITLTGTGGNNTKDHQWLSSLLDGGNVSISSNGNIASITGTAVGTVNITHSYKVRTGNNWSTTYETINITVIDNSTAQGQNLYIYTLIPGADPDANKIDPNLRWNGMGITTVNGLNNVNSYSVDTLIYGTNDINANIDNGNIVLPTTMVSITYNGKNYEYWGDDEDEVGTMPQIGDVLDNGSTCSTLYYTIEWFRLVVSNGANAGNNGENTPTVDSGKNTFHLDGRLVRNDILHVDFKLMAYDSDEFEPVNPEVYSWDIEQGHTFYYSAVPTNTGYVAKSLDVDSDGEIDYTFDGWYTKEDLSGDKYTFEGDGTHKVTSNVTFYGRYIPVSVADPDQNYITITKTFSGIESSQIPNDFSVNVGDTLLDKNTEGIVISNNGLTWTWKLNVNAGSHNISEGNANVDNYDRTVTVNGIKQTSDNFGSVTAKKSNITLTQGAYYESCNNTEFDIGVNGNTNTIFFGATKTQVVVISTNSFSEGQKAAIIEWLNEQKLSGNWSIDNVVFYSQAEKGNSFKLLAGTVSFDGNTVKFGNKKMWTHAMTATYDVTQALNPDVDIVNSYVLKTIDITVKKEVTGLGADKTKSFVFTYSYDDVNGEFTLSNNGTTTIEDVPLGTKLVIQETNAQGYDTSAKYGKTGTLSEVSVTENEGSKNISITVTEGNNLVIVTNSKNAVPITGITDNTPKGLGMIGTIVAEAVAIAFVLKKKRQLKM